MLYTGEQKCYRETYIRVRAMGVCMCVRASVWWG